MRHLFTFIAMLALFLAGTQFAMHLVGALVLLGAGMLAAGFLFASAETHGFEGYYVNMVTPPYRWETLFLDVVRLSLKRNVVAGNETLYVLTPDGVAPITGIYAARVNHEMAIVLDTSEPVDAAHEFNSLKQGVM